MKRGFTLVEVVLAIAIGALLLLAVYGVLAAAERTRTTIDHQTRAGRAATAVFNQLRADLAAATIYRDQEVTFLCDRDAANPGAPQRLDFLTLAPPRSMPEVDGEPLRNDRELLDRVAARLPGDKLDLLIDRDGEERTLTVELGGRIAGLAVEQEGTVADD